MEAVWVGFGELRWPCIITINTACIETTTPLRVRVAAKGTSTEGGVEEGAGGGERGGGGGEEEEGRKRKKKEKKVVCLVLVS